MKFFLCIGGIMFYCKTYLRYYLLLSILPKYYANKKESQSDVKGRFLKDLDDAEWHVSHLRDLELGQECEDETFADKVKRYRKTLRNDGALVEFVSSNAIPFNPYDNKDKCKVVEPIYKKPIINTTLDNSTNRSEDSEVKTATVSSKAGLEQEKIVENNMQRRSEYQFSSVEYYDEIQDFDASVCPDEVEVIKLEIDQLRNYYVECEAIVEWRSLE